MEPLSFKEQIKVYASSQVLLMTHGAALVNIMFMPEVSLQNFIHCWHWVRAQVHCVIHVQIVPPNFFPNAVLPNGHSY